jgi:hypothetical protein
VVELADRRHQEVHDALQDDLAVHPGRHLEHRIPLDRRQDRQGRQDPFRGHHDRRQGRQYPFRGHHDRRQGRQYPFRGHHDRRQGRQDPSGWLVPPSLWQTP